jgi:putative Mg2+ transporter-C (MgtC) family protein
MFLETEHIIQVCAAFTAGGILGLEREYRSKPAGFRTIILITVGSCLFSILSASFINNADRIAANIVSGIGFIGAGVVFKEGASVRGITSAATIWIAAAIGMCIGFKFYGLASLVVGLVLATLIILSKLEEWFDSFRQEKEYVINFKTESYTIAELENEMEKLEIYFVRYKFIKQPQQVVAYYKIVTRKVRYEKLNLFLLNSQHIISFEV